MASSSAAGALPGMSQINELKTKLYDRCSEDEPDTVFRQEDLIFMNVIPDGDVMLLLTVTQKLCDEKLFKLVRDGQVGWMYRPVEDAAK
jgi:DNA-directed RNA polymerase III subunit RPC6